MAAQPPVNTGQTVGEQFAQMNLSAQTHSTSEKSHAPLGERVDSSNGRGNEAPPPYQEHVEFSGQHYVASPGNQQLHASQYLNVATHANSGDSSESFGFIPPVTTQQQPQTQFQHYQVSTSYAPFHTQSGSHLSQGQAAPQYTTPRVQQPPQPYSPQQQFQPPQPSSQPYSPQQQLQPPQQPPQNYLPQQQPSSQHQPRFQPQHRSSQHQPRVQLQQPPSQHQPWFQPQQPPSQHQPRYQLQQQQPWQQQYQPQSQASQHVAYQRPDQYQQSSQHTASKGSRGYRDLLRSSANATQVTRVRTRTQHQVRAQAMQTGLELVSTAINQVVKDIDKSLKDDKKSYSALAQYPIFSCLLGVIGVVHENTHSESYGSVDLRVQDAIYKEREQLLQKCKTELFVGLLNFQQTLYVRRQKPSFEGMFKSWSAMLEKHAGMQQAQAEYYLILALYSALYPANQAQVSGVGVFFEPIETLKLELEKNPHLEGMSLSTAQAEESVQIIKLAAMATYLAAEFNQFKSPVTIDDMIYLIVPKLLSHLRELNPHDVEAAVHNNQQLRNYLASGQLGEDEYTECVYYTLMQKKYDELRVLFKDAAPALSSKGNMQFLITALASFVLDRTTGELFELEVNREYTEALIYKTLFQLEIEGDTSWKPKLVDIANKVLDSDNIGADIDCVETLLQLLGKDLRMPTSLPALTPPAESQAAPFVQSSQMSQSQIFVVNMHEQSGVRSTVMLPQEVTVQLTQPQPNPQRRVQTDETTRNVMEAKISRVTAAKVFKVLEKNESKLAELFQNDPYRFNQAFVTAEIASRLPTYSDPDNFRLALRLTGMINSFFKYVGDDEVTEHWKTFIDILIEQSGACKQLAKTLDSEVKKP